MKIQRIEDYLLKQMNLIDNELDRRDKRTLNLSTSSEEGAIAERHYIFLSEFGKEFEDNFQDLNEYFTMPFIIDYLFKFIKEEPLDYFTSENFIKQIFQYVQNLEKKVRPKNKDLRKAKKWFRKIRKLQDETRNNNNLNKDEEAVDIIKEVKMIPRETAYFIFSLYAFMDLYCTTLIKYFLENTHLKDNAEIQKALDYRYNPPEKIKTILKQIQIEGSMLSQLYNNFLHENDMADTLRSFTEIINIRHPIAHISPIINFEELKKKFPKQHAKANKKRKEFNEFRKKIENGEFEFFKEAYEKFVSPFENSIEKMVFIKEIGKSAIKYLALIDNLLFIIVNNSIQ